MDKQQGPTVVQKTIQYPVTRHNGKQNKKSYIHAQLNYFALEWKLTQHWKSTHTSIKQILRKERRKG